MKLERNSQQEQNQQQYMREGANDGPKLFQNKTANKVLIVVGVLLAVLIIGSIIFVSVPIG